MAEVKVREDESIEDALRRFGRLVAKQGIFRELKARRFARTKSQKRREKSKYARRRLSKNSRHSRPEYERKPWVTDTTWEPDMTLKPDLEREGLDFAENQRRIFYTDSIQEEPTIFVAGIAEYFYEGTSMIIILKNKPDSTTPHREEKFSFSGGGVKVEKNEKPGQAMVREFEEETGFKIAEPSDKDIVFTKTKGLHTVIFYKVNIIGGTYRKGSEIEDVRIQSKEELLNLISIGGLRYNHSQAFLKYIETQEPEMILSREQGSAHV